MNRFFFILLLILGIHGETYFYTGSMNGSLAFTLLTLNVSFTEQSKVVSVIFRPSNSFTIDGRTTVLAVVKFEPILQSQYTPQIISKFLSQNSNELMYMRPIDAIGGFSQVINLPIPVSSIITGKLYIGLFNFDLPDKIALKQYTLRIDTLNQGKICLSCPTGTYLLTGSEYLYKCQCSFCRGNSVGSICQYQLSDIMQGESSYFTIDNKNNKYYRVFISSSSAKLSIYTTIPTNSVKLYVQYQKSQSIIAGKINSYHNQKPLQYQINNTAEIIQIINIGGKIALLTFINYDSTILGVNVNYIAQTKALSRNHYIILIVCLVVFIVVIIVVAVLIRRWWVRKHNIAPSMITTNQNLQDPNILTEQQINGYFPLMKAYFVIQKDKLFQQKSLAHLQSVQQESNASQIFTDYQCAICFQMIKYMEDVRVVYCKHIFHDKCLLSWFSKNFNCPICRKVFDYNSTKNMYAQVSKGKKLKGKDLGRAILGVSGPANIPKILIQKQLGQNIQKSNKYEEQDVQSSQYRQD